jgi:hypothetical protein
MEERAPDVDRTGRPVLGANDRAAAERVAVLYEEPLNCGAMIAEPRINDDPRRGPSIGVAESRRRCAVA